MKKGSLNLQTGEGIVLEGCPRGREKGRDPMCKWIGQFTEQQEGRMLVLMQAGWVLSWGEVCMVFCDSSPFLESPSLPKL